jgi:pimeloyl-ACP methyl ester carboxylesterase
VLIPRFAFSVEPQKPLAIPAKKRNREKGARRNAMTHRTPDSEGNNLKHNNGSQGHYAELGDLRMYYEIHGAGKPLVLLGGGFMTVEAMGQVLGPLSESRQIIAAELQGHGHTADIDGRPLSYMAMADDITALIKSLGLESADIFGYSLGGVVALQTAIRHPEMVQKLVLVSAAYQRRGWYPEVLAGMASMTAGPALLAPATFVDKMRQLLSEEYDWTESVAQMKTPILIIVGDADSVRLAHAVEMFDLLGGGKNDGAMGGRPHSQLAVIPDATHFTVLARTDLLLPVVVSFLDS